ncbi:MAG: response regulator [Desulfuromonadaceae bacterium]|nr:response regulator [Desulfuromonadaceae bacterium]
MPKWQVLVVDDEPSILFLITNLLINEDCEVETATNSADAWEKLNQPEALFSLIILDRMMPGMDGLDLLRMVKADSRLASIPVIMESGATAPEQVAEGIEAGAFYYLTKPYTPNMLLCIVRAVFTDIERRNKVYAQSARYVESLKYFTRAELRFASLEDVNCVAGILSAMCPDPESASSGLAELLLNAIEHGNLGISYNEKKQLMFEDRWESELNRRLTLPEYAERCATVTFDRTSRALEFRITDQGNGFDWSKYLTPDPERALDPNGRGIAMARRFSFNTVEYEGTGNVVTATIVL